MGSEPDRKRRHFSSFSPTAGAAAAAAKKQFHFASSEDKKLDVAVLQYQNQKLLQQVEAQKVEYFALENKFHQLEDKQKTYDDTLLVVNKSWECLVEDLESSVCTSEFRESGNDLKSSHMLADGTSCSAEEEFLNRLQKTGATESCSDYASPSQMEYDKPATQSTVKNLLQNILCSINSTWHANDKLAADLILIPTDDEHSRRLQNTNDLQMEVRNFHVAVDELHLGHRLLADKVRNHRDMDAKLKAEHKRLAVELATTIAELEESTCKLAVVKGQRETPQGKPFPFQTLENKHSVDSLRDKQKELQDLESTLKEMTDLFSSRLVEIKSLHEERIEILDKLATFKNVLMDVKSISSSKAFLVLRDQLDKSKAEMDQWRALLEKLQVENDNLAWHEEDVNAKIALAAVSRGLAAFSESHIADLEHQVQKLADERVLMESKLEAASREPGRKEIIAEFKALVSSLPEDMAVMQTQLSKFKESASEIHSLRAEVQSLSSILHRKVNELEALSSRSADQLSEIKKLQAVATDLRESDQELKLILEMYRRESTETWDVIETRDVEYKAWAHVQTLKISLDDHSLELRVKAANEAEAVSQQRLATAEAEIADLRQKLEASGKDICRLSVTLKSKHEEGESYLSEIESIGQAYEEMQTQNQHLLQQITERDDYNIKVAMEGVKARQLEGALRHEIQTMAKEIKLSNSLKEFYNEKVARLDDQLKVWSEQLGKLADYGRQNSILLENTQRRLSDVTRDCQQSRRSMEEMQSSKVERSRLDAASLLIEVEKERFNKKRIEEELEVISRRATSLGGQTEGSATLEKLQQEITEYRTILKCGICHDQQKEVVIAKCYHLFCSQCVERTLESRRRKCPTCSASFGPNDVKPIYI